MVVVKAVAGDGEWELHDEQRATGPFDALVRALRAPSERGDARRICSAVGMVPIVITLTDADGRTTTPAIPQDRCGLPQQKARQAIQALPWRTVTETRVRQTRSQTELESGCPGQYKPVIAIEAAVGRGAAGTAPLFPGTPPTTLQVCRYTLDPTSAVEVTGSGTLAAGRLTTATTLTGPAVARLVAGLNAAPPVTGRCDQPEAPFAVLADSGVVVETGGCHRTLSAAGGLRQVDPATAAILTG
ncbi:hypothetical protein HC031_23120 [Planosporangium thailandense]|uniref:Uncharacterized protein n=1 Tax=Planosporangium thailandense TaxID=765197 RepID=A0ABX0Y2I7_9ACTN|nr:hypothetical protein [Planosporangium thailandense]NJC72586.1 hypothetical protein [Planosporangium thailandense]